MIDRSIALALSRNYDIRFSGWRGEEQEEEKEKKRDRNACGVRVISASVSSFFVLRNVSAKLIKATGNFQESLWNRHDATRPSFLIRITNEFRRMIIRRCFAIFESADSPFPATFVLPFRADGSRIPQDRYAAKQPLIARQGRVRTCTYGDVKSPRFGKSESSGEKYNREKRRCLYREID